MSFKTYIVRIQNQIDPEKSLRQDAVSKLETIIHRLLHDITRNLVLLLEHAHKITITSLDVQTVVRMMITNPALLKNAVTEGQRAVHKLVSKKKSKKRVTVAKTAGIVIPPPRIRKVMEENLTKKDVRISPASVVYLAAVIDYLIAEILDVSTENTDTRFITKESIEHTLTHDREIRDLVCSLYV